MLIYYQSKTLKTNENDFIARLKPYQLKSLDALSVICF